MSGCCLALTVYEYVERGDFICFNCDRSVRTSCDVKMFALQYEACQCVGLWRCVCLCGKECKRFIYWNSCFLSLIFNVLKCKKCVLQCSGSKTSIAKTRKFYHVILEFYVTSEIVLNISSIRAEWSQSVLTDRIVSIQHNISNQSPSPVYILPLPHASQCCFH